MRPGDPGGAKRKTESAMTCGHVSTKSAATSHRVLVGVAGLAAIVAINLSGLPARASIEDARRISPDRGISEKADPSTRGDGRDTMTSWRITPAGANPARSRASQGGADRVPQQSAGARRALASDRAAHLNEIDRIADRGRLDVRTLILPSSGGQIASTGSAEFLSGKRVGCVINRVFDRTSPGLWSPGTMRSRTCLPVSLMS